MAVQMGEYSPGLRDSIMKAVKSQSQEMMATAEDPAVVEAAFNRVVRIAEIQNEDLKAGLREVIKKLKRDSLNELARANTEADIRRVLDNLAK